MKKVITILLSILMVVSLAACGGQSETVGQIEESSTTNEPVETTTPDAEETAESTDPVETEAPTEPEETTPAFDTSWAGDGFVMPIPEPPFAYEVSRDENFITIKSTNGGKDGDVSHQSILDYCEALKNAGFTLDLGENEIGERYGRTCYEFYASDANGNNVNLLDDGGGVVIWLTIKAE